MKKGALFIVLFIFLISFISASYNCSTGSLIEEKKEISLNNIKLINGLEIGLIKSDESILQRYSAEVFIDAGKFYLNNDTNFTEDVELKEEEKTVTLLNLTYDTLEIKVDGDSETIDIYGGETVIIDSFLVFILDTEGNYPGTASVDGIIGTSSASLDNNDSSKIVTINEVEYLIKLYSASDSDATIIVGKCENENATMVETADPVVVNPPENSTENITLGNNLPDETTIINSSEETINQSSDLEDSVKTQSSKSGEKIFKIVVGIVTGLIVIVFVIFLKDLLKRGDNSYRKE